MSVLSNARHEAFAQALARGATAEDAYAAAGFKPDRGNASRLTANDSVRARVAELQGRASAKVEITLQFLLEKAEEARQAAMDGGQPSAAVAAIKELGILSGLRVAAIDMTTRGTVGHVISDKPLSPEDRDAEWLAQHGTVQ